MPHKINNDIKTYNSHVSKTLHWHKKYRYKFPRISFSIYSRFHKNCCKGKHDFLMEQKRVIFDQKKKMSHFFRLIIGFREVVWLNDWYCTYNWKSFLERLSSSSIFCQAMQPVIYDRCHFHSLFLVQKKGY